MARRGKPGPEVRPPASGSRSSGGNPPALTWHQRVALKGGVIENRKWEDVARDDLGSDHHSYSKYHRDQALNQFVNIGDHTSRSITGLSSSFGFEVYRAFFPYHDVEHYLDMLLSNDKQQFLLRVIEAIEVASRMSLDESDDHG